MGANHEHEDARHNGMRPRQSYGGMLSAMNSMNATERRERSGSPNEAVDRDALQSESVVSSSLPASYGGII